ncbi:Eco57I restriction-modification methylase domain-containing protein [Actinomadura sp. 9N407]|uniref:Eco57I restriction-modification methylase domain-containing protein n=1 Tax=Actinomadura sp. 9N407 TaxID=3375154 RepID=UPI003796CDF9
MANTRYKGRPQHRDDFDHTTWLELIDVSGPFLSVPVLRRVWPTLDPLDKPTRERLRQEHAAMPGRDWIDYVLDELLGWDELLDAEGGGVDELSIDVPEHDATITPSFALREPGAKHDGDAKTVRLLGLVCEDRPTQRVKDSAWAATPVDRLAHLCRHHDVELGLATDGRWWALVWAPRGGVTTTAVFDSVNWHEKAERDVVRAFVSILGRSRFFSVPEDETPTALLKASLDNQEEITEALGVQVRQAVELLVAAIGRAHTADVAQGGPGIGNVTAHEVYRGAVAVMMRVVFLLFAEERGLLPADKPLYRSAYSAGLLGAELEQRARDGSEVDLEHTYTGWHRLLALFNAVYYGVDHPDMPMHAHDGSIFDPKTFDWLPHAIDDRTVLHMLKAVQTVEIGTGKSREPRKISFRALDVEQIGYVYEGLLSFEGFYADETFVGLIGKAGIEEEVALSTLEAVAASADDVPALAEALAVKYKDSKIGSAKTLEKRLAPLSKAEAQEAERKLLAVTGGDLFLARRLLPFYNIIRTDLRDLPVVILTDALYVTESSLRKNTGTHYTPKFLATQVVEGALEPLVFSPGPLQTADKSEWKPRSSDEILALKVADIAMGSAAFLVAACRFLADHLVNAWIREDDERAQGYRGQSQDLAVDADEDPVVVNARRHIIEHCLYGADINEMAVEMAKLSLWLVSMDPRRPFTFLDDRLIVGDSLLGITSLDQLEVMHMDAKRGRAVHENAMLDWTSGAREVAGEIAQQRRAIVDIEGTTLEALAQKRALLAETGEKVNRAWLYADLATAGALAFAKDGASGLDKASVRSAKVAETLAKGGEEAELIARDQLALWLKTDLPAGAFRRQPIHWPLVFPEVFENGGFNAVIGNPPFLHGSRITAAAGIAYREYLVESVSGGERGNADLVTYFILKAHALCDGRGQTGLVATNTLAQGDTREVGLDRLLMSGIALRQAIKSRPWPSKSAALEYCAIWTSGEKLDELAPRILDGVAVPGISSSLNRETRASGRPFRLANNGGRSFLGSKVEGAGFIVDSQWAAELLDKDARYSAVLSPYLIGRDVASRADSSASRWVINFYDWPESKAVEFAACYERVASLVKPERERNKRKVRRERWWQYGELAAGLYKSMAGLEKVCAIVRVGKTVMPVFVATNQVLSDQVVVVVDQDAAMMALLSSAPHYWWAVANASSMKTDLRYTPSDVYETLPLPDMSQEMRDLGARLDTYRRKLMLARRWGLTKTYNLVHDLSCLDVGIMELRAIHKAIDEAVCRAYGWDDLVPLLDHGHHDLGRETRYTVAAAVQQEFVERLLELNHERYAAEVAAGLHDKKKSKKSARAEVSEQGGLF